MSPTNKQNYHCQTSTLFQISRDFLRLWQFQCCYFSSSFIWNRCEIKNFFTKTTFYWTMYKNIYNTHWISQLMFTSWVCEFCLFVYWGANSAYQLDLICFLKSGSNALVKKLLSEDASEDNLAKNPSIKKWWTC